MTVNQECTNCGRDDYEVVTKDADVIECPDCGQKRKCSWSSRPTKPDVQLGEIIREGEKA
jgi:uncharacterized Zn finger protein